MSSVLFILFILIIFRVSNNDIGQINDNDNYFCEKRIYDQGSNFTASEINEICKILDFQLLDHIIISDDSYTSLKEEGVF